MNDRFPSTLGPLVLAPCLLALAACGDDGSSGAAADGDAADDGGSSSASQAVVDACAKAMRKLDDSIVAAGCESNFDILLEGCKRKGVEAEGAGCLAEFETEHACLDETITDDACTCNDGTYGCSLPCLDEVFAREQCVDGE